MICYAKAFTFNIWITLIIFILPSKLAYIAFFMALRVIISILLIMFELLVENSLISYYFVKYHLLLGT